jgi:hypothetical protein
MERDRLSKKWSYKNEGTPETHEHVDQIPTRRREWPLHRMFVLGKVSADEKAAGEQIAAIYEMIQRDVSVRSSSIEARVDNSGSARDVLIESLGRIRMEVAYRAWRSAIPKPAGMILAMITTNQSYVAVAKRYRLNFKTARKRLLSALRMWPEFRILAKYQAEEADVNEIYSKLGEGVLLPPLPKLREPVDE